MSMRNITTAFDKSGNLIITIAADKKTCAGAPLSASGKTNVFGTTSGNVNLTTPDGRTITLGVNAYVKAA